ncbi:MAG TPA: formate dehydrogenase accessory protein FdhE [Thermodesulfobacteriota bacterium]|nr:formate dehydrogenase accessory protein FdhE [Thermodesulfobacteriota bacterium]
MSFRQRDQTILSDLEKAQSIHRDIKELLNFYQNLFQAQFAFKSQLRASGKAKDFEEKEVNLAGLTNGLPQITFEELNMPAPPLLDLYKNIVQLLTPFAGESCGLETAPPSEKIIEWAREIFHSSGPLVISGATVNWARTACGFVLAPYLQLACDLILPRTPLDLWYREYCPICGGRPAFAALTSGSGPRTLLCPRCYGEWTYGRIGCPFCKSTDSQTYYSDDEGRYRLYVCGVCNRYLKTVDLRERSMDLCLPVECLVTVSMDIAAQEKGFKFYDSAPGL